MASRINFKETSISKNACFGCLDYTYGVQIDRFISVNAYRRKPWYSEISEYFKISRVDEIHNPYVEGMYLLYKEELKNADSFGFSGVEDRTMYHATSPANAAQIASENIDWRKTRRSRYGVGAYFSPCPAYADRHSGSKNVFLVCKVLVKKKQEISISYNLNVPDMEYDTVSGNNNMVYVKFDDFTFYPEYIVHYDY